MLRTTRRPNRGRLLTAAFAIVCLLITLFATGPAFARSTDWTGTPDSTHPDCAAWINTHAYDMTNPDGSAATDWYDFSSTPVQGPLRDQRCYSDTGSLATYIAGHGDDNPLGTFFTNANYGGFSLEVLTFFPKQCNHPDTPPGFGGPNFSIYGMDTLYGSGFNDNISSYFFSNSEQNNCTSIELEDGRPSYSNPPGSGNHGNVSAFPPYYNYGGHCPIGGLDCASGEAHARWADNNQTDLAGSGWNDSISVFQIFNKNNFCPFPGANNYCGT